MKIIKISLLVVLLLSVSCWFLLTQPVFVFEKEKKAPLAKAENLKKHVKILATDLSPREYIKGDLENTASYLHQNFSQHTKDLEIQTYLVEDKSFQNIIAHFGDLSKKKPIVLGAHYDAYEGLPGADDNASGVAGLLEIARLLSEHPVKTPVMLVAYSTEEPPYFRSKDMGSFQHAKKLAQNQTKIELMLSLEMIGYFSDKKDSQDFPVAFLKYFYPDKGNFIALVSNLKNMGPTRKFKKLFKKYSQVPVYSINAPTVLPGIDFSDHTSYWQHQMPALMMTDTAFYRNKAYHTAQDTPDRLDYERMAQVVDGIYYTLKNY